MNCCTAAVIYSSTTVRADCTIYCNKPCRVYPTSDEVPLMEYRCSRLLVVKTRKESRRRHRTNGRPHRRGVYHAQLCPHPSMPEQNNPSCCVKSRSKHQRVLSIQNHNHVCCVLTKSCVGAFKKNKPKIETTGSLRHICVYVSLLLCMSGSCQRKGTLVCAQTFGMDLTRMHQSVQPSACYAHIRRLGDPTPLSNVRHFSHFSPTNKSFAFQNLKSRVGG